MIYPGDCFMHTLMSGKSDTALSLAIDSMNSDKDKPMPT